MVKTMPYDAKVRKISGYFNLDKKHFAGVFFLALDPEDVPFRVMFNRDQGEASINSHSPDHGWGRPVVKKIDDFAGNQRFEIVLGEANIEVYVDDALVLAAKPELFDLARTQSISVRGSAILNRPAEDSPTASVTPLVNPAAAFRTGASEQKSGRATEQTAPPQPSRTEAFDSTVLERSAGLAQETSPEPVLDHDLAPQIEQARGLSLEPPTKHATERPAPPIAAEVTVQTAPRFLLHLTVESIDPLDSLRIECAGKGTALKAVVAGGVDPDSPIDGCRYDIHAPVPGWIWADTGEAEAAVLRVMTGAVELGGTTVTRSAAIAWVEAVCSRAEQDVPSFDALSALEHYRFLGDDIGLSEKARAGLRKLTTLYRLDKYMPQTGAEEDATAQFGELLRPVDLERRRSEEVIGNFARRARAETETRLKTILLEEFHTAQKGAGLKRDTVRRIVLGVCDFFCARDAFIDLYEVACRWQVEDVTVSEKPNNWEATTALPFLAMRGQAGKIASLLADITKRPNEWMLTAALAWTVEKCLRDPEDEGQDIAVVTEQIADNAVKLLEKQAASYWTRGRCRHLTRMAARIAEWQAGARPRLAGQVSLAILRCYGLSPAFWEALDIDAMEQGKNRMRFETALATFEALRTKVLRGDLDVGAELDFFSALRNHDAERYRIELLGPFQRPVENGADLSVLMRDLASGSIDLDNSLMRGFASPLTGEFKVEEPVLASLRQLISERRHGAERTRLAARRRQMVTQATALLQSVSSDTDTLAETDRFLRLCEQNEQNGLKNFYAALATAVYCGLSEAEAQDAAARLAAFIAPILSGTEAEDLLKTRFMRSVIARLQYNAAERRDLEASSLYALIPKARRDSLSIDFAACDPEMLRAWLAASPVFDTIVMIYTCRKYVGTRVAAQKDTWIRSLKAHGIPYLVCVGGGDDTLEGDLLSLAAGDGYEDLPQKTLAMVEWAYEKTPFAHIIKVDDDCFLNCADFFSALDHRQSNYNGRPIVRAVGTKPRDWHMEKSHSYQGQHEFDKSKEPSRFADGGSTYALSRDAMKAALQAKDTEEGHKTILTSYSEDKLLGDLLSQFKIGCHDENLSVALHRRTHSDGVPLMQYSHDFWPSRMVETKVVHLDDHATMADVQARSAASALHPRKIWPSMDNPRLGFESKSLELLSSPERVRSVCAERFVVGCVLRNEKYLLPAFLDHYRSIGAGGFIFVDNLSDDGTLEYLLAQEDCVVLAADTSFKKAAQGTEWKQAILGQLRLGRWTLIADADELLVFPGFGNTGIGPYLDRLDSQGYDATRSYMIDMYPKGSLSEADMQRQPPFEAAGYVEKDPLRRDSLSGGSFSTSMVVTSALRHRLIPHSRRELFVSEKVALIKYAPWMRLSLSMHFMAEANLCPEPNILAHFKYNSEFLEKARREAKRGQYFNNGEEYKKYLALMSEGREVVFDPAASVHWRDCKVFQEVIAGA